MCIYYFPQEGTGKSVTKHKHISDLMIDVF